MPRTGRALALLAAGFAALSPARAQTNDVPVAQPTDQTAPPTDQSQQSAASTANTSTTTPSTNAPSATAPSIIVTTPAAARFDAAMVSFNAGQYADAVSSLSDFVRDFPQDRRREEALYRLAESYRNLGRTDDALAAYTFQVQTYPDGILRADAELRRGAILFDQGKFTDAIPALQFVADKGDGENQQAAKYFLGRSLLATQKESDGRALLQALVDQTPPSKFAGPAAQDLAQLDDSQNQPADALALWQKAVNLATDNATKATAAARGGWSALAAKKPDDAVELFQITRQLAPDGDARKVANTGLLRILFQKKNYAEWLRVYAAEKDKLLESARPETLYDLGHAQFTQKHWPEAVAAFDQFLAAFGTIDNAVTAAYERFLALAQLDRSKTATEAETYLKAWPQSPYRAQVRFLEAQELSHEKKFADALPLWVDLSTAPANSTLPHQDILLELARAYDETGDFAKAATAYQSYLDDLSAHPGSDVTVQAQRMLLAQARLAVCLQKSDQLLAATEAWKAVQSLAPDGSKEQQAALESLGLIYAKGGPAQAADAVATFQLLLQKYPASPLAALAAFSVGDSLFQARNYAGAEPLFRLARTHDPKAWQQPATQRLVLGAYGQQDYAKTVSYLTEYDAIPLPTDPAAIHAAQLPSALFYWLGQTAQKTAQWPEAEIYYTRFVKNPDVPNFAWGGWWNLGEVQSRRKEWPAAVASYERARALKPETANATSVLLALGRAQLGAQNTDAAKKLGDQALLQEPEGPNSAASRMLLGETAFAAHNYPEAARMFATLAVLFDDPKITPQAMARAADSFGMAGDSATAAQWQQKLQAKYPGYQEASYL